MKTGSDTLFFVLPEGATQEEQWNWEDIEHMCASGQFSADTRIFIPEDNAWVRAGDTELAAHFDGVDDGPKGVDGPEDSDDDREALETDYNDALKRINSTPEMIDAHLEAGRLAAELGNREAAGQHFQAALKLKPFNGRVALEIKRRFSKTECRDFKFLEREAPVWENIPVLLSYPYTRGLRYIAVVAAVTCLFLFVPYGSYALGVLLFLLLVQVARHTAAGSSRLPLWQPALASPVRELVFPSVSGAMVAAEYMLLSYAVYKLSVALGADGSVSAVAYVRNSPILIVLLATIGLAYLPAVLVRLSLSNGIAISPLNPWACVKSVIKMEHEYLMSLILLFALGLVVGGVNLLTGWIPILGKVVLAALLACAFPIVGFILGRLQARMQHLF